jgi:type II secretory pathway pseudopilin PulG
MFQTKIKPLSLRYGLSLVEIMIAMVMTLIVLGAMMAAFSYGSAEMQKGRASIELNNRLITAEELLRRDLSRITVELKPYHQSSSLPKGYVEIVDGPQTDYVVDNDTPFTHPVTGTALGTAFTHTGNELVFGDRDDYFACTIQSDGKAFRGRLNNEIEESHLAEVVWFTVFDPSTPDPSDVLLIRRQLLILAAPPAAALFSSTNADLAAREVAINNFIQRTDISARIVRTPAEYFVYANSMANLAFRGNRFSHTGSLESLFTDPHRSPTDCLLEILALADRYNETHVVASSVAAFDVQVFDPNAVSLFIPNSTNTEVANIAEPGSISFRKGNYGDDLDGTPEPADAIFDAGDPNAARPLVMHRQPATCSATTRRQVLWEPLQTDTVLAFTPTLPPVFSVQYPRLRLQTWCYTKPTMLAPLSTIAESPTTQGRMELMIRTDLESLME